MNKPVESESLSGAGPTGEAGAAGGIGRAMGGGLIGLCLLLAFMVAGDEARKSLHLPLPGPVIGLALLTTLVLLVERFHARSYWQLTLRLTPVSRLLVSHLGLLFVPAGVGIITEGEALRREWLPIVAALLGSTWIGLATTGWLMQRFAPPTETPPA
jgi:holin-like protein